MGRRFRYFIIAVLVVLQAATISALWLVSGSTSEVAVSDHLDSLIDGSAEQVALRTSSFIRPAEDAVNVASALVASQGTDAAGLEEIFRSQLQRTSQLAGIYVAYPDGGFLYVSRDRDGFRTKRIDAGPPRQVELVFYDRFGVESSRRFDPSDTYDPRTRVWYGAATSGVGGAQWTDPYVFFTSQTLGTTAAMPVLVRGELAAVVGADIELEALSDFLATLPVGENGGAVITNGAGTVIAHPDPEMTRRVTSDGLETLHISELEGDPIARQAFLSVGDGVAAVVAIPAEDGSASTSRATGQTIPVGGQLWAITIHADSGDFVGGIDDARRRDRQLLLAIGVVAALVGGLAVFPATRPIARLAHEAATDPLTRVHNRRSISQRAHVAAGERGSKTVALVDVDNLRGVNLAHGQLVGDEVLAEVADRLKGVVGSDGHVGRVAGEEFLLVFPRRSWEQVDRIIDDARRSIRNRPFDTSHVSVEITVSIGVASDLRRTDGEALIRSAADALAQAKRFGPDRVRVSHVGEDAEGLTHITVDLTGDTAVTRIVVPGVVSD